jgi:hypothetical protein
MTRQRSQPDSLEMLLDTMCNTFGGIVLIALLVTLLSRETRLAGESSAPENLSRRLEQAMENLKLEQQRARELDKAMDMPPTAERIRLVEQRHRLEQSYRALVKQKQQAENELEMLGQIVTSGVTAIAETMRNMQEKLAREIQESERQTAVYQETRRALEMQILQYRKQAQQLTGRQTRVARIPRERSTTKRPWEVILRYERVYPVHFSRAGEKERNTTTIQWSESTGGGYPSRMSTIHVEPILGRGWAIGANQTALEQFFRSIRADAYYVVFRVYADSFAIFPHLCSIAAKEGLEFGWDPLTENERLTAGAGAAAPPPQ